MIAWFVRFFSLATLLIGSQVNIASAQVEATAATPSTAASERDLARAQRATLEKTIALHLDHVTLRAALAAVSEQAGINVIYSPSQVPLTKIVSLTADQIAIGDAMRVLLQGTGLITSVSSEGRIVVKPSVDRSVGGLLSQQGTATISGLVTDSGTGAIITQAIVHVDGTQLTVRTNATGHYAISALAAGEYRVNVRHVGYLSKTHTIALADGDHKTLDFALNEPATQLNEVVTTALGEQRRYQVGNVISTINVDSVAPLAPVTSVTDLLAARVPGLEVVQSNGLAGSGPDIRIRGQSSMLLQSDPIIIVDGIRMDNTPGSDNPLGLNEQPIAGPAPARINDLDFNEIESISVLKGPTATTEYGTDAANGVIVITTKRGHAGTPTWDASATEGGMFIPTTFPALYWDWGHKANGVNTPTWSAQNGGLPCNLLPGNTLFPSPIYGTCLVDSITAFTPFNHGATTEYGTGPTSSYELNVAGGNEQVRYFLGGNLQNAQGLIHVPDVLRSEALALGYSNSALQPNSQNQGRLTANGNIQLSQTVTISVRGGYMSTYMEAEQQGFSVINAASGPAIDDSAFSYGYGAPSYGDLGPESPLALLGNTLSQETESWTGAGTVDWRPTSWMAAHLTTGIDHEAQIDETQALAQAALVASNFTDSTGGVISQEQIRNDIYTVDARASATAALSRFLHLITTVGAQYTQSSLQGTIASASNLAASAFTLNNGTSGNVSVGQSASQAATEGVYAEEQINVGDRCSLPLALRLDAGAAFGANVGSQSYPKWAVSCQILTGATVLRVRGAYGAAGIQPPQGSATDQFAEYGTATVQPANGPVAIGLPYNEPGNPNIRPEDDIEWEGGFDLNAWGNRLSVSVTAYNKYAHNALYPVPLGDFLQGSITENVGDVRNMGQEVEVTVVPLMQRSVTASITLSESVNRNKLLRLAPGIVSTSPGGAQFFVAGYPLYSFFGDTIRYTDVSHDGILEPNELYEQANHTTLNPSVYMGVSLPPVQMAIQPSIAFVRNALQINAVFQYQGGSKVYDDQGALLTGQGANVLGAPPWLQAYDLVSGDGSSCGCWENNFLDGSYLAWNELSIALSAPVGLGRAVHIRNAQVVLGVSNLALWTPYPFGDPRVGAGVTTYNGSNVNYGVNNDVRSQNESTVPLTRQWMVRLNLGL